MALSALKNFQLLLRLYFIFLKSGVCVPSSLTINYNLNMSLCLRYFVIGTGGETWHVCSHCYGHLKLLAQTVPAPQVKSCRIYRLNGQLRWCHTNKE